MRAELLNLSIFALKKLCGGRTVNCSETRPAHSRGSLGVIVTKQTAKVKNGTE